jgi:hypothetical protein
MSLRLGEFILGGQPLDHVRIGLLKSQVDTAAKLRLTGNRDQVLRVHKARQAQTFSFMDYYRKFHVERGFNSSTQSLAVALQGMSIARIVVGSRMQTEKERSPSTTSLKSMLRRRA